MDILNERDLGWIAGIIDGEGTIGVYPDNAKPHALLRVAMADEPPVRRLHKLTSVGHVHVVQHKTLTVGGQLPKLQWSWQVKARDELKSLLKTVLPALVETNKRRQAWLALMLIDQLDRQLLETRGIDPSEFDATTRRKNWRQEREGVIR